MILDRPLPALYNLQQVRLVPELSGYKGGAVLNIRHTQSMEDYLEAILMIQQERGLCRSVDVAARLGFTKPSVSIAMKNLATSGYVSKAGENGLQLTEKGLRIAQATLERHRFLCAFFTDLGVAPDVAERDACGMEHSISEESFEKFRDWYIKQNRQ